MQRREFLKTGAAGGLLASLPPALAQSPRERIRQRRERQSVNDSRKGVVLNSRRDLNLDSYAQVCHKDAILAIGEQARARIANDRQAFLQFIETQREATIYGVTSGYGTAAKQRFTRDERIAHARLPQTAGQATYGPTLPREVTRGIAFARLANFIEGDARVSLKLVEVIVADLNQDSLAEVPENGLIGGGDLMALTHLFGEYPVRHQLAEKEGGALLNGAPCAAALMAEAALSLRWLTTAFTRCATAAIEAFLAPLEAYNPRLASYWTSGAANEALGILNHALAGAQASDRRPFQAPISYRAVPRYLAFLLQRCHEVETAAEAALSEVTDNPLLVPPLESADDVLSNGGFLDAGCCARIDDATQAMAEACLVVERLATALLDPSQTGHLSKLGSRFGSNRPWVHLLTALGAYAAQARELATATLTPATMAGGGGQNDLFSPMFPAFQKSASVSRVAWQACASGYLISQGVLLADERPPLPGQRALAEAISPHLRDLGAFSGLGPAAEATEALLKADAHALESRT